MNLFCKIGCKTLLAQNHIKTHKVVLAVKNTINIIALSIVSLSMRVHAWEGSWVSCYTVANTFSLNVFKLVP